MAVSEILPRVESKFFAPPAELEGCFTTFYRMRLFVPEGELLSDLMPPEWASIRFFCGSLPEARLGESLLTETRVAAVGPSSLAARFSIGATDMWGIGFLPLGWARYFDTDAHALANHAFDGEQHPAFQRFAGLARHLCEPGLDEDEQYAVIKQTMLSLAREHPEEVRILRVHKLLLDENITKVTELAERAETSVRSLERVCDRFFGFSPKILLRRQRFMRSLSAFMLHDGGMWTDAMDAHYHDQAQFSREFVKFMGMTPSQYAAQGHPFLKSFIAARARMLGSPAQTLDAPSR